ncbi:metallophosphoesterase [Larkinella ripae]
MSKAVAVLFVLWLGLVSNRSLAQTDRPLFTFGVMTDVQYCDCETAGTRHYRSSLRKLTEAIRTFNQEKVAFVLHLGDFIDRDFRSYDTLNTLVRRLNRPLYQVLGNHDFSVQQEEIEKVPALLGMKNRYYSFTRNRWRFIVLDGNDLSVYGNPKTSPAYAEAVGRLEAMKARQAPNAQVWNGGLGTRQIQWLRQELAAAAKKGQKVLVLGHMPLWPETDPHNLWNAEEVRVLLENQPNVLAYFNGHVHQPSHSVHKGLHFVTFKGMVEKEENAYAIITVYRDSVRITGYASEADRVLTKD